MLNGQQRVGWWRVHPTTGETIGVMDTGFHGATEDAVQRALEYLRRNAAFMRRRTTNPLAYPNDEVQICRRALRALFDAGQIGL
jgi:hypothetical protein